MHFVFNVKIDVHSSVSESLIVNTIERGRERRRERERKREKESERQGDRETQTERHRDRERERVTLALAHLVSIIGTFIRVYSGTHEQPYL